MIPPAHQRHRLIVLLLTLSLLIGCSQSQATTTGTTTAAIPRVTFTVRSSATARPSATRATPSAEESIRAALAALPATSALTITDDWSGFSATSPHEAHYRLTRQGDGFDGPSRLVINGGARITGDKDSPRASSQEITIPAELARQFLSLLANVTVRAGEYTVPPGHSDDYPLVTLILDTPAGPLTFHTTSNAPQRVPWQVRFDGRSYVVADDTPQRALALLEPALRQRERFTALDRQAASRTGTPIASRPATPLFCQHPAAPGDPLTVAPSPLAGQTTNSTAMYGLTARTIVTYNAPVEDNSAARRNASRVAALVMLLDQPLPHLAEGNPDSWSAYDGITITLETFAESQHTIITARYNVQLGALRWYRGNNAPFVTLAPPALRALILADLCGV